MRMCAKISDIMFLLLFSGERLGMMQSLAGLVAVLSKFSVAPSKNTVRVPKFDPTSNTVSTIVGGLPLLFTHRN